MNLHFNITNDHIKLMSLSGYPVSDSINHLKAVFEFDGAWEGFTKTAIFSNGNGSRCVLLENDECIIPWETLTGRHVYISVYGVKDDVRITATEIKIPLAPSGYTEGKSPEPPTPTVYEQLLERIGQIGIGGSGEISEVRDLILSEQTAREEADAALASALDSLHEWKLIAEKSLTDEDITIAGEEGITGITVDLGTPVEEHGWYGETMIKIYVPKSDDINPAEKPLLVSFGDSEATCFGWTVNGSCNLVYMQSTVYGGTYTSAYGNTLMVLTQWKNKKYRVKTDILKHSVSSSYPLPSPGVVYNDDSKTIIGKQYLGVGSRSNDWKFPSGTKIELYGRFKG